MLVHLVGNYDDNNDNDNQTNNNNDNFNVHFGSPVPR